MRAGRSGPTPLPIRFYRIGRASLHLFEGLVTLTLVFPWIAAPRRQALIRRWSSRLLRVFAIETDVAGRLHEDRRRGLMLVANHVSWLDIFVLNAIQPSRFIAKAELRRWPMIGSLIAGVGTLFIDRRSIRHAHEVNRDAGEALARGDVVAVFPEGATSDGREVLPFHGSLLQPAVEQQGFVQPVAIRYRSSGGAPTTAPAYLDEISFLGSVWRIAGEPALRVELSLSPALAACARHRRELAREAERLIREALGSAAGDPVPDTRGDHRA